MTQTSRASYRRKVIRFILLFCVFCAASSGIETWMRRERIGTAYQAAIAATVCALLQPAGVEARREPQFNAHTIFVRGRQLVVTIECAAVLATGLFLSAVLAFPCSWRARFVGMLVGVLGVGFLNLLRIMILTAVANWHSEWFDPVHDVLMQGFLLIMVAPLWLVWVLWATSPKLGAGEPTRGRSSSGLPVER